MAAAKAKRNHKYTSYLLPILFCALLIALTLTRGRTESPAKAVVRESEPLTLTRQAIENYLFSAGFTLQGEALLDADQEEAGSLSITEDEGGVIRELALRFPLPTRIGSERDGDVIAALNRDHEQAAQQGQEMFLSLFDAISVTDGRVAARRDSCLEKLSKAMDDGKASAQAANSWRFSFSLEPGETEGRVTVLFARVK